MIKNPGTHCNLPVPVWQVCAFRKNTADNFTPGTHAQLLKAGLFRRGSVMKHLVLVLSCVLLALGCQDEMLARYGSMDIPQTKLGVLFLVEEIPVKKKNLFGVEKDLKNPPGNNDYRIREAILKDCKYLTKFKNVTVENLQNTDHFRKHSFTTASGEAYELLLPDSGMQVRTVNNDYDFILFIQGYKITIDNKAMFYGGFGDAGINTHVQSGCVNHYGSIALWDNMSKEVIKHDFVHVYECTENSKVEASSMAVSTTEFVLNIFEDTPFAVKLLDASDFK
jgi:hypothetical protein